MKIGIKGIVILSIIIICILGSYSFYLEKWSYFNVPLQTLLSILVAILFAFYYAQYKTDERQQKEVVKKLIDSLISIINKPCMYQIKNGNDIMEVRISQRSVFNKLDQLAKFSTKFKYQDDIKQITKDFSDYWSLLSENITSVQVLMGKELEFSKILLIVEDKLESVLVKIYL